MKKQFLIIALLICSLQLFGQEAIKTNKIIDNQLITNNAVLSKISKSNTASESPYELEIYSSGEFDNKNRIIVANRVIVGKISLAKNVKGSVSNIKVTVSQAESGDVESTQTNPKGEFRLEMQKDTVHIVLVNDVEFEPIKIISNKKN